MDDGALREGFCVLALFGLNGVLDGLYGWAFSVFVVGEDFCFFERVT